MESRPPMGRALMHARLPMADKTLCGRDVERVNSVYSPSAAITAGYVTCAKCKRAALGLEGR